MNLPCLHGPLQTVRAAFAASLWLATIFAQVAWAADTNIIAPGQTLQKLTNGFSFTEGPACDAAGNIFFTDQPNDRILEWSTEGKLSTFMQPCGRANGLSFDRKGNLWACADETNALWRISPNKKIACCVRLLRPRTCAGVPSASGRTPRNML